MLHARGWNWTAKKQRNKTAFIDGLQWVWKDKPIADLQGFIWGPVLFSTLVSSLIILMMK